MFQEDILIRPLAPRRVWWTPRGAWGNARRIQPRMPDCKGWVMITLTLDHTRFDGPLDGYQTAMRDFKFFQRRLSRFNGRPLRWARKMELHVNGWPHWHLICNLRKLSRHELARLDSVWSHGATNIKYLRNSSAAAYCLKYAVKTAALLGIDDAYGLPDWVLDYQGKLRWWQTHDFYDVHDVRSLSQENVKPKLLPFTIRESIDHTLKSVEILVFDQQNRNLLSRCTKYLDFPIFPVLVESAIRDCIPSDWPPDEYAHVSTITIQVRKCPKSINPFLLPRCGKVFLSLAR